MGLPVTGAPCVVNTELDMGYLYQDALIERSWQVRRGLHPGISYRDLLSLPFINISLVSSVDSVWPSHVGRYRLAASLLSNIC